MVLVGVTDVIRVISMTLHHSINAIIIDSYEVTIDVVVTVSVEAVVAAVVPKLKDGAEETAVVDVAGVVVMAGATVKPLWRHRRSVLELKMKNLANIMLTFCQRKIKFCAHYTC